MASQTTRGYEYPTAGDDIGDLPAKVQELAETVDGQLKRQESGVATSASLGAGVGGDITIAFGAAFAAAPVCLAVAVVNGSDSSLFPVMIKTRSTTGMVIRVKNGSGSSVAIPVCWLAIG